MSLLSSFSKWPGFFGKNSACVPRVYGRPSLWFRIWMIICLGDVWLNLFRFNKVLRSLRACVQFYESYRGPKWYGMLLVFTQRLSTRSEDDVWFRSAFLDKELLSFLVGRSWDVLASYFGKWLCVPTRMFHPGLPLRDLARIRRWGWWGEMTAGVLGPVLGTIVEEGLPKSGAYPDENNQDGTKSGQQALGDCSCCILGFLCLCSSL